MKKVRNDIERRKRVDDILEAPFMVTEESKISFDGKQLLARIPKEIAERLSIKKGDRLVFILEVAREPKPIEESRLTINYLRGENEENKASGSQPV